MRWSSSAPTDAFNSSIVRRRHSSLFTLHIWSNTKGKAESLALIEAAKARLHDAPLELATHKLVNLRQEFAESRFDEDLAVYHGLLRFRAVTGG